MTDNKYIDAIVKLVKEHERLVDDIEILKIESENENLDKETDFYEALQHTITSVYDSDDTFDEIIKEIGVFIDNVFFTWEEIDTIRELYTKIQNDYKPEDIQHFLDITEKEKKDGHFYKHDYDAGEDVLKYLAPCNPRKYGYDFYVDEVHNVREYIKDTYEYFDSYTNWKYKT